MIQEGCIKESSKKEFMDVNATTSNRSGLLGLMEANLRRFRTLCFTLLLAPIAALYVLCMGLSLIPGITLFQAVHQGTQGLHFILQNACLGITLSASFFLYGLSLIFIVPMVNKLLPLTVRPHRATWFSLSVIPWYYHNALTYLVRYTFLDLITPTPMNKLF